MEWSGGVRLDARGYAAVVDERPHLHARALSALRRGRTIVRVDLGRVSSTYAGETAQRLSELFDEAENKGWVLVFDEADALFGRRTDLASAHDRYAGLDPAFLLDRIDRSPGAVLMPHRGDDEDDDPLAGYTVRHFPPR